VRFVDDIRIDATRDSAEASLFVDPLADYLADHFPGAPMLPGLLMLESAVRAAGALWSTRTPGVTSHGVVLDRVDRLHIVRRVSPGETLTMRVSSIEANGEPNTALFRAEGVVGEEWAMRVRFRLRALASGDPGVSRWEE
jgi:3-hydroxyacyl-[acyl-carrier-protein] dehydratase